MPHINKEPLSILSAYIITTTMHKKKCKAEIRFTFAFAYNMSKIV